MSSCALRCSWGAGGGGGGSGGGGGGGGEGGNGDGGVADIDQTIDRYDYLIAFPHPIEGGAREAGRRRRGEVRTSQFRDVDTVFFCAGRALLSTIGASQHKNIHVSAI